MRKILVLIILLGMSSVSWATPEVDALGRCLTDHTTGRERKDLARWMYLALGAHPEIKQWSQVKPADLEQTSRATAVLFTRLIADTCAADVRATLANGGTAALQLGFQVLGQLAVQELMSHPDVGASIGQFERFVDQPRIAGALQGP